MECNVLDTQFFQRLSYDGRKIENQKEVLKSRDTFRHKSLTQLSWRVVPEGIMLKICQGGLHRWEQAVERFTWKGAETPRLRQRKKSKLGCGRR